MLATECCQSRINKPEAILVERKPGLKVIKLSSFSTHVSIKFSLLLNIRIPTIVTFLLQNRAMQEIYLSNKFKKWQQLLGDKFLAQLS